MSAMANHEFARLSPQERYQRDANFKMLVDMLTDQIVCLEYTPTELREAAMLAALRYELIHARPAFLLSKDGGSVLGRVDSYHGREDS
jgi:hypothetical protein